MFEPNTQETIANIPNTILKYFGYESKKQTLALDQQMKGCAKVMTFVVDGLGYNFLEENTKNDFRFRQLKSSKQLKRISTVFPSSTAPALMALASGQTPIEHALAEWNMYSTEFDDVINPLPYQSLTSESLLVEIPEVIFRGETVYQKLKTVSVDSFVLLPEEYSNSLFTRTSSQGAKIIGYTDPDDLVKKLNEVLEINVKAYIYVYWPFIDVAEHEYGPSSSEARQALADMLDMLFIKFARDLPEGIAKGSFLFLTADHGQIDVDPNKVKLLNDYPYIVKAFQKSPAGKQILPAGNDRDVTLHIGTKKLELIVEKMKKDFQDFADVYILNDEFIERVFGRADPHAEFLDRLGNVIVLPKDNYRVWYRYSPETVEKVKKQFGSHGGISDNEMYVPLLSANLSDLKDLASKDHKC